MESKAIVDEFKRSWVFTRSLTLDFAEALPEAHWSFTFHEKYSPLCKQLRHMIWVTGLYTDALRNGSLNFEQKKSFYSGSLNRDDILPALRSSDAGLLAWLEEARTRDLATFTVKAFEVDMGFSEYSHILLEHEANHHGLWSTYATLAGFPTPKSWTNSWGL